MDQTYSCVSGIPFDIFTFREYNSFSGLSCFTRPKKKHTVFCSALLLLSLSFVFSEYLGLTCFHREPPGSFENVIIKLYGMQSNSHESKMAHSLLDSLPSFSLFTKASDFYRQTLTEVEVSEPAESPPHTRLDNVSCHQDCSHVAKAENANGDQLPKQQSELKEQLLDSNGLVGTLPDFLNPSQGFQVKEGPVGVTKLNSSIQREGMTHVYLEFFRLHPVENEMTLNFRGPECPAFENVGEEFDGVDACWNSHMVDPEWVIPKPPINCPDIPVPAGEAMNDTDTDGAYADSEPLDVDGVRFKHNPECTHMRREFVRHEKLASQLFVLHNVFMNSAGRVFNASRHYDRNGCGSDPVDRKFVYPTGTVVHKFKTLVNLAHWNAWQFYHGLVETLPQFYLLSSLMQHNPQLPIAMRKGQVMFLDNIGKHLTGFDSNDLNIHPIPDEELFFAERLVLPIYQYCSRPSRHIWTELRASHLLPKQGLPMFFPNFTRNLPGIESTREQLSDAGENWTIVLAKRKGSRSLVQSSKIEQALKAMVPSDRVYILEEDLPILEARLLFNRARLFVAVHGASMTNMLFMPLNSSVLEIRPRDYINPCYHYLAEVCDINYYLLFGEGTKDTPTSVNSTQVVELLKEITKDLH